ncbi:MAG TPA: glycine--tRNA ligase subunit beta, partial [Vampirovibrionales bacterium]
MDYLFEIGTEELPAGSTGKIVSALQSSFDEGLKECGLAEYEIKQYFTPRRIALLVTNLPKETPSKEIEVKGPGIKAPEQAVKGFAAKYNLKIEDLLQENNRYFLKQTIPAISIKEVLKTNIQKSLASLSGERWMTWADGEHSFARPVKWIVSLLEDKVLDLEVYGLQASNKTRVSRLKEAELGEHKFFEIQTPSDYESLLKQNYVTADAKQRKELIKQQIKQIEENNNLKVQVPEDLLEEVVDLVEEPRTLVTSFAEKFLELPEFLTTTVLINHQRY